MITRTYGGITDALSLAAKAGAGDAFRWQFGAERQFQGQLDSEQEMRNRQQNAEISLALEGQRTSNQNDQFYANLGLEGRRLDQQGNFQQGELANQTTQVQQQGQYQQGQLGVEKQKAATDQQRANDYSTLVKGQSAKNQAEGEYYGAKADQTDAKTGGYAPGNPEYDSSEKMLTSLQNQLKMVQASRHSMEIYGQPVNPNDQRYQSAVAAEQQLTDALQRVTNQHASRQGMASPYPHAPGQAMQPRQPQQQPQQLMPGPGASGQPAPQPSPVPLNTAQGPSPAAGGMAPPGVGGGQGTTVVIGAVPVPLPAAPPQLQPPQPGAAISQYPQVQQQLLKLYMDKVAQSVPPKQRTPQALDQGYIQYITNLGWRPQ